MHAISIIKSEHKNLGAVLYSLEKLIEEIDNGKDPDFGVFHGLLTYIDRFLDRFHHPKENHYLFPKLLARSPESESIIRELALSAYEFSGAAEYPHFRDVVLRYTEFERRHAQLEEDEILPRAREALEAADWEEIDAAFAENDDPIFGKKWNNEFSDLLDQLINRLPAPLGLGDIWK
jgi:branched-chain amino acid transport system ATP-binding protein